MEASDALSLPLRKLHIDLAVDRCLEVASEQLPMGILDQLHH